MADLPPEIFDHHTAIVGRTGSGKSYAARGIVERWLEAGLRVCVIDPTDVWWGLRSNPAGNGPGYPVVIFGGEHADVPIGERSGARIAEIVGGRNLPAVIATAEMTVGERHRFMTDFLGTLYRSNRTPLHLVLDEADDLAPQNPLPENRRMLGDVDRIVRRGRVRGFRVIMITQRPAVIHKNILSQASTLIAMRLPAKQDRDAIEGWIKGQADVEKAAEVLGSLSRLDRGAGWVWAPDVDVLARTVFPPIRTFDSMRTPEHGATAGEPTSLAAVELGDLCALLAADAPSSNEAAKSYATDEIAAAERRGYERGLAEGRTQLARVERERDEISAELDRAVADVDRIETISINFLSGRPRDRDRRKTAPVSSPAPPAEARTVPSRDPAIAELIARDAADAIIATANGDAALPSSAVKMLAVLARGMRLTWAQTATLAGLKARGGHFNAGRKALRDGGLIEETAAGIVATERGLEAAGGAQPKPASADELLAWWRWALPNTPGRILDQLYRQDGKWMARDRLAAFLGLQPRGGHWNGAIAMLRQNSLVEVRGDKLRAGEALR
jgi:hypothetical protein